MSKITEEMNSLFNDDPPSPIKGYRALSPSLIEAINEVKTVGEEVERLVQKLRADSRHDQRWVSIGVTQIQQGFMALTRAIARPTTFA